MARGLWLQRRGTARYLVRAPVRHAELRALAAGFRAVRSDDRRRAVSRVQLGSRYHDGKPGDPGKDWWGTVNGFQPPGSLDFHHTIRVSQLRATVDVYIHYSFERADHGTTDVTRWLVLDFTMPIVFRPLRRLIIKAFDEENVRTMAAVKQYAEAHPDGVQTRPQC